MDAAPISFLHKPYLRWLIGIGLLIGTPLFFWGGPDYESPRSFKEAWNLGHILYFALLTYLLRQSQLISRQSQPSQWGIILAITLIAGILVEALQYGTQREADLWDISRNLTGSFLMLSFSGQTGFIIRRHVLKATAVVLLLAQLVPLGISLIDETIARQQFPVLADFETPFETGRWTGDANMAVSTLPASPDNSVLTVWLTTQQYSGVALKYFPRDWRSYRSLKISVFQPDKEPLAITCRIHDLQHTQGKQDFEDRYNRSFLLHSGWNEIEIDLTEVASAPASRKMDMSEIHGLGLFAISLPYPRQIHLGKLFLSN